MTVTMRLLGLVLLLLLMVSRQVTTDQFTAMIELERTLQAEGKMAEQLYKYIAKEEERLSKLRNMAKDMEVHSQKTLEDPVKTLGNPINSYQLMKRYTVEWDEVMNTLIYNNNTSDLCDKMDMLQEDFPDYEDYTGTIEALIRLTDTYALDPKELSRGKIRGCADVSAMSAHDCFELGRVAYDQHDHYHTIQWMQQALELMEEEDEKSVDEGVLLDYLTFSLFMQGNLHMAKNLTMRWLKAQPDHARAQNNLRYFEDMISKQSNKRVQECQVECDEDSTLQNNRFSREKDVYRSSEEFKIYEALCRGEDVVKVKDEHKLTCQYRFWHPMFYIDPLREEIMNIDPQIAVYHQLMNDKEIEKVKELGIPRLARATVHNVVTGKLEHAKYRISKSGWIKDQEDPIIAKISARCSALTNLSLSTVEELQVSNYGVGGHYEPHFDHSRRQERDAFGAWRGNRILTVIFYMSDVVAGGGTVFLGTGSKLYPEKGAAGVWHNLLPSGEGDMRTRHAACPVLVGSKWVCNKWFHERGQEFRRPCGLKP